jgi:hypothetical protein
MSTWSVTPFSSQPGAVAVSVEPDEPPAVVAVEPAVVAVEPAVVAVDLAVVAVEPAVVAGAAAVVAGAAVVSAAAAVVAGAVVSSELLSSPPQAAATNNVAAMARPANSLCGFFVVPNVPPWMWLWMENVKTVRHRRFAAPSASSSGR